jgi:hypothetical protein
MDDTAKTSNTWLQLACLQFFGIVLEIAPPIY